MSQKLDYQRPPQHQKKVWPVWVWILLGVAAGLLLALIALLIPV